jgi:UDP-N-acetylglucosamine 2-epimerase (non-hydrolysing)
MEPVVRALAERGEVEPHVILTGQHKGLEKAFDFLPRAAVETLGVDPAEQTAGEIRETIHDRLCARLDRHQDQLVLVQGDTSSAAAGALAAHERRIPIGHVEAGLRSFDRQQPWPEEDHRVLIDELADLLFAPTETSARNLAAEPAVRGEVLVTGNTGIDALLETKRALPDIAVLPAPRRTVLLTCHRRENRGAVLRGIAEACQRLVAQLPLEIVIPLHPNHHVRTAVEALLGGEPHIHLIEPVSYAEMVSLMDRSWLIITDSGGIQEEAPALGRPVLVLRNVTERQEALASDSAELVGTDPARLFAAVQRLVADEARYKRMARPAFPFGDGKAATRIAEAVERFLLKRTA